VCRAATVDLSGIRPFVKKIVFQPSKYSWDMTNDIYGDISIINKLFAFCQEKEDEMKAEHIHGETRWRIHFPGTSEVFKLGYTDFVRKYMDGEMPISRDEIEASFEKYMGSAIELRGMFESGQVHHAWTNMLLQLPNVHTFGIGRWKYEDDHKHDWHKHNEVVCRQVQEPVGEAVFNTTLASLISAGSRIEKLRINSMTDCHFAWADNGTLDALDLSCLHALKLDIECCHDFHHNSLQEDEVRIRFNIAVTALLRKCQSSLRHLRVLSTHCPDFEWPPTDAGESHGIPPLPALESFTTELTLLLPNFADLLLQSCELKHLKLNLCHGDLGDWHELWDAIRNHPSRMLLTFDQLPCNEVAEVSMDHHTGEESKEEWSDDVWGNINYSLENYLSGRRHWDRTLQMWFGDGDGGPTDDEEDDDTSGDNGDGSGSSEGGWEDLN
jgi:hypothetical protein